VLGLDVIDLEVEMELLGVVTVRPLWGAVVLDRREGQLDLTELDAGPVVVAARRDGETRHLRIEGPQHHRVRAVDDDIGQS